MPLELVVAQEFDGKTAARLRGQAPVGGETLTWRDLFVMPFPEGEKDLVRDPFSDPMVRDGKPVNCLFPSAYYPGQQQVQNDC